MPFTVGRALRFEVLFAAVRAVERDGPGAHESSSSLARAADLISELERRLPGFDAPVTINVNGCPNSCARIQTADIGLKGSLVTGPDGQQVEGFQVHLGGSLSGGDGSGSGFGRKVRGLKTTAEELPDYVERVLRRFDAAREPGESFAAWTVRASDEELS